MCIECDMMFRLHISMVFVVCMVCVVNWMANTCCTVDLCAVLNHTEENRASLKNGCAVQYIYLLKDHILVATSAV